MKVARLVVAALVIAVAAACSSDVTGPSADAGQPRAENLSTMGSGN